jgi:preprotein translocase subunit Sec61beta
MNKRAQKKVSMPSSFGGIMRYFDEYKSRINIKPGHVVFIAILTIITVMMLHIFGSAIFGF